MYFLAIILRIASCIWHNNSCKGDCSLTWYLYALAFYSPWKVTWCFGQVQKQSDLGQLVPEHVCVLFVLFESVWYHYLQPLFPQPITPLTSCASFCGTEQPNLWAEAFRSKSGGICSRILKRGTLVQVSSDLYIYFRDLQDHLPMAGNHLWAQEAILSVVVVLAGSMPVRQHIGARQVSLS